MIIGIVGGMGSYATADLFRRMLDAFPAEKEWDRPRIIVDNYCTMPSRVRAILYNERRDELVADLSSSVKNMLNAGVDKIVLACNTSQVFLPDIIAMVPESAEKFVRIIDALGQDLEAQGIESVGLIASEGTIYTKIYNTTFEKYRIKVNAPDEKQFVLLREFIESVKQNMIDDKVMVSFESFVNCFTDNTVILGCTELPILYSECVKNNYKFERNVFDPLQSTINVLIKENLASVSV